MDPLMDNYLALYLCIKEEYSPDKALIALGFIRNYKSINQEDTEEMIRMRSQGMTYKEIGKIFGTTSDTVYQRIRRVRGVKANGATTVGNS